MKHTKHIKVGRFTCEMVIIVDEAKDTMQIDGHWFPRIPKRREFNQAMWKEYREGRDQFLLEVLKKRGNGTGSALVVEV